MSFESTASTARRFDKGAVRVGRVDGLSSSWTGPCYPSHMLEYQHPIARVPVASSQSLEWNLPVQFIWFMIHDSRHFNTTLYNASTKGW